MVLQKWFNQSKKVDEEKDLFDQLKCIVSILLKREVSTQTPMHQLILNSNIKIQKLTRSANYHRNQIDMYTSIGVFHKEAYEETIKQRNQLQILLDYFIKLNIEDEFHIIHRRLAFYEQKIATIYKEIEEYNKHQLIPELDRKFWKAIKEDFIPILASLR